MNQEQKDELSALITRVKERAIEVGRQERALTVARAVGIDVEELEKHLCGAKTSCSNGEFEVRCCINKIAEATQQSTPQPPNVNYEDALAAIGLHERTVRKSQRLDTAAAHILTVVGTGSLLFKKSHEAWGDATKEAQRAGNELMRLLGHDVEKAES